MINVLIADDHKVLRDGLKHFFSTTNDIVVADEAENSQQVLDKVTQNDFDVVLLDLHMPGRGGLEIIKQIKDLNPSMAVLVLTMYPEELYAVRALKSGASGYFTKESSSDELVNAIRRVADGHKYISPVLAEKLAYYLEESEERPLHEKLSNREYTVMLKIAEGKSVKEISQELSLSSTTISTYRYRILEKMNLSKNSEITHYALFNNLLS